MAEPAIPLNSAWLRHRVAELKLKHGWLAEQAGVDKKTVLRWLQGKVRSIQPANAQALAAVLGCGVAALTRPREAVEFASPADQRAAAALLATSALLDRLGPAGEWGLAERLLKAVAAPDLPLPVLGALYNDLCTACWRQSKLDDAETVNRAALDVARRCGDRPLLADALLSQANLRHWRGDCAGAIAAYQEVLTFSAFIAPRRLGAIHNNLGAALCESGAWDEGEAQLHAALGHFQTHGTPMNHSITHGHLALLALQRGRPDVAQAHHDIARTQAAVCDYRRGLALAHRLAAEIAALRGDAADALASLRQARMAYAALAIAEAPNHEAEARVLRLLGHLTEAVLALEAGEPLAAAYPLEAASLQRERAQLCATAGDLDGARGAWAQAAAMFDACGAPRAAQACMPPHVPGAAPTT